MSHSQTGVVSTNSSTPTAAAQPFDLSTLPFKAGDEVTGTVIKVILPQGKDGFALLQLPGCATLAILHQSVIGIDREDGGQRLNELNAQLRPGGAAVTITAKIEKLGHQLRDVRLPNIQLTRRPYLEAEAKQAAFALRGQSLEATVVGHFETKAEPGGRPSHKFGLRIAFNGVPFHGMVHVKEVYDPSLADFLANDWHSPAAGEAKSRVLEALAAQAAGPNKPKLMVTITDVKEATRGERSKIEIAASAALYAFEHQQGDGSGSTNATTANVTTTDTGATVNAPTATAETAAGGSTLPTFVETAVVVDPPKAKKELDPAVVRAAMEKLEIGGREYKGTVRVLPGNEFGEGFGVDVGVSGGSVRCVLPVTNLNLPPKAQGSVKIGTRVTVKVESVDLDALTAVVSNVVTKK